MKLSDIGEFGFIDRVASLFKEKLASGVMGIGDDCAVIPQPGGEALLITTDTLIDGVHFLIGRIPPFDLGFKSLAVNLSDIAAMGGSPSSVFLSLGIPKDTEIAFLELFLKGFYELSKRHGVQLLGGDTTGSPEPFMVNVVVLGKVSLSKVKLRSSAITGDVVCVTGELGDSGGGLRLILDNIEATDEESRYLIGKHYRPWPHIEEGKWLAEKPGVHAMMDLSDGIDSDCMRIAEQSRCGMEIYLEKLPISEALKKTASRYNWDAFEIAATGGEDYCLLFTADGNKYEEINSSFKAKFGRPVYPIGKITDRLKQIKYFEHGKEVSLRPHGFDHFKRD
ncbi:MAG: thiamine-phosphate kinase [Spirochaetes bacterium]|nr:MAG: thiamine-phosphate kinase [Spirochaetota bacterium]